MKKSKPNLEEYFILPNPNLRSFLHRNVTGNDADYRPPFWKNMSRSEVAAAWKAHLDESDIPSTYPTLYEVELKNMEKIGPMSVMHPLEDVIDGVESYFRVPEGRHYSEEALRRTIATFSKMKGIRIRSRENTVREMKLSTNSGAPYFKRKSLVVKDELNRVFVPEEQVAIKGWRGQLGGPKPEDVKQRTVWMYPFLLNIEELRFYQPFIKAAQRTRTLAPYISNEAVEEEVTKLFDTKHPDDLVVVTDYTAFDEHINVPMQEFAAKVYSALSDGIEDWLNTVYPVKYNIPIILSEDIMLSGPHGMGSGSGGTNADETVQNIGMQHEAAIDAKSHRNPHSMAIGDDAIVSYPGITVDQLVRVYEQFGQEMNPDKQFASTNETIFLQRYYNTKWRNPEGRMLGIYPTMRALGRLLAQERFYDPKKWGPKQVTLRAWSILENLNRHPLFEEFIQFVMKGDKYRLGIDIPGFIENVNVIAQRSIDELPDFLGFTATLRNEDQIVNIKDWRVYRYLSSIKYNESQGRAKL